MADFPISQSIPNWKVGDYNEICSLQGPTIYISEAFGIGMTVLLLFMDINIWQKYIHGTVLIHCAHVKVPGAAAAAWQWDHGW